MSFKIKLKREMMKIKYSRLLVGMLLPLATITAEELPLTPPNAVPIAAPIPAVASDDASYTAKSDTADLVPTT